MFSKQVNKIRSHIFACIGNSIRIELFDLHASSLHLVDKDNKLCIGANDDFQIFIRLPTKVFDPYAH